MYVGKSVSAGRKPLIVLTMGDPCGVGPEICVKAAANPDVRDSCRLVLAGDKVVLKRAEDVTKMSLVYDTLHSPADVGAWASDAGGREASLLDCSACAEAPEYGRACAAGGAAAYKYLINAIDMAISGTVSAIATAPLNKAALQMAGIRKPGHTEILAEKTGIDDFALMLYSSRMSLAFVTCHVALRDVPGMLTCERIFKVTGLLRDALLRTLGREPRLCMLGLNPHAGEGGVFGGEEQEHIASAVRDAVERGWNVEGPVPPDAAFTPKALRKYDGHVAMYHDQGHIPFKMVSFHDGVNVTLGLPIIRTSVAHGTAFDIAGKGTADESSLTAAILLASRLSGIRS